RSNNSWQGGLVVSAADFADVDGTELARPRKADGSLPDMNFLHLVTGSDLIDAGIDVGIPFSGKGPDLGPFETQSGSTNPIPAFTSAAVENATPSLLEMTYNMTLANIVPASSVFSVLVNSIARTVNSVSISGSNVLLTLASAIKFGDIITVSYTKPANNPLQTVTGGQAASISAKSITNNIINPIKDATSAKIVMTISPNPVHHVLSILFVYSSTFSIQDPTISPQIIRIFDTAGKLFIEKLLVTGVSNVRMPINLRSGVYNVLLLSGSLDMASQNIIVYK
ncbi:MAG: SwmB domain-containing protein, partial [Bacteroidales bacterium]